MRPSMFMGGGATVLHATFVGMAFTTSNTFSLSLIPGLQVGDYVFLFCQAGASDYGKISRPGWSADNYTWPQFNYRSTVFHRQITAIESVTISGMSAQTYMLAAYRGASRASRKSITISSTSTLVAPGFNRAPDCVGVLCSIFDRDNETPANFTVPSPWVRRSIQTVNFFRASVADALPRASYVDGASLTWSSLGLGVARVAMMYEMRL